MPLPDIVKDGQPISVVEEERFNRKKHCAGFLPKAAHAKKVYRLQFLGIGRVPQVWESTILISRKWEGGWKQK